MIASVNLDVSIVNVTNESVAGRRKKGRERKRGKLREKKWRKKREIRERERRREKGTGVRMTVFFFLFAPDYVLLWYSR